jgi:hypothetical protein
VKPALSRYALAALLAAPSLLAACGGESGTVETECKMAVDPGAVALGMLCVDGESQATFNVLNSGSAECIVNMEMGGVAPQYFAISTPQVTVVPGGSAPVTVTYHPTADAGAVPGEHHFARVKLSSNAKENPDYEVSVDGETAATASKAILSLSCAESVKSCVNADPSEPCCRVVDQAGLDEEPYYGRSYLTSVEFGAVQTGRTVTVPLKVTNLGCGQLDLSALNFVPTTGTGYCGASSVAVVTPLPVSVAGSVSAQTRQSAEVELQFTPSELCAYFAGVTVESNDPDISPENSTTAVYGKFSVTGSGTEGRVRTFPTAWYFGDVGVGETVTQVFNVTNVGTRAAEVSSLALRGGPGVYQIVKVERPNCPAGSGATDIGVGTPFTLAATDNVSNCGEDQVDVTVAFTPNDAGKFENYLDVAYGEGTAVIPLTGASYPTVEVTPDPTIKFFGPHGLSCEPYSCTVGDAVNASCAGICASDADCMNGAVCLAGVCSSSGFCTETCGEATRPIRICNSGHAPLKFDDASDGGGVVITGPGGHNNPPPMHRPIEGIDDPARNNTPVFSIGNNGCADTAGTARPWRRASAARSSSTSWTPGTAVAPRARRGSRPNCTSTPTTTRTLGRPMARRWTSRPGPTQTSTRWPGGPPTTCCSGRGR